MMAREASALTVLTEALELLGYVQVSLRYWTLVSAVNYLLLRWDF